MRIQKKVTLKEWKKKREREKEKYEQELKLRLNKEQLLNNANESYKKANDLILKMSRSPFWRNSMILKLLVFHSVEIQYCFRNIS